MATASANTQTTRVDCGSGQSLQAMIDATPTGAKLRINGTCVGDFIIGRDIALRGERGATLQGDGSTVLTIGEGATVVIRDLTITGGKAYVLQPDGLRASGIFNSGKLSLDGNTRIANNTGITCGTFPPPGNPPPGSPCANTYPAVVYRVAVVNTGTLIVGGHASLRENVGGIRNAGALIMRDHATIEDNFTEIYGGGVWNEGIFQMFDHSAIQRNDARNTRVGSGGGIYNEGVLDMYDRATVRHNSAAQAGGGIANTGDVTLNGRATVESNLDGGIVSYGGPITLNDRATISNNFGIGILGFGGTITLNDRYAITGNVSDFEGGGIHARPGTVIIGSLDGVFGNSPDDCFGCR